MSFNVPDLGNLSRSKRRRSVSVPAVAAVLALSPFAPMYSANGASDVPVPSTCTAAVNAPLAGLVAAGHPNELDNVMVCGVATRATYFQPARNSSGSHHVTSVSAPISTGGTMLVEIVTNDSLDGVVSAQPGDRVFAFGQFYQTSERQRPYVAGIHDTHCSTHSGADNGWVVVNDTRWPHTSC